MAEGANEIIVDMNLNAREGNIDIGEAANEEMHANPNPNSNSQRT
ncbi:unnamed protein product, partial [Rotaria sp. Silwood1]